MRNTRDELAEYDPEMDALLARIFSDFGLVVAGWSGAYDTALREAIEQSPNARYGTYWAARGPLEQSAEGVIQARNGQPIPIRDADSFFLGLEEQVRALERMAGGVALTAAVASNRVKTYVVDDRHRIDLHDLATQEIERLLEQLGTDRFPVNRLAAPPNNAAYLERLLEYQALSENALAIISTGARWGEPTHAGVWSMMIDHLLSARYERGGLATWINLQLCPALLLLYGAGIGAMAGGHDQLVAKLLTDPKRRSVQPPEPAYSALATMRVLDHDVMKQAYRPSEDRAYKTPTSQYLFDHLREPLRGLIPDAGDFEHHFDRFEYLTALIQDHRTGPNFSWFHVGCFAWRNRYHGLDMAATIDGELERYGVDWPLLAVGEFDGDLDRVREIKADVDQRSRQATP